jgi:alkylation response protein AidB-like acyl-CoA dehydrogenase
MLEMLRTAARDWASAEHPVHPDHEAARVGHRARWEAMAALGWTGMAVPEALGGLGLGMAAFCAVAEEMGRELVASPLLSCGLVLALLGDRPELVEGVIAGRTIVALASEEGAHHGMPVRASAEQTPDGWRIVAAKRHVADAPDADWFIVTVADGGAFLLPRDLVAVTPLDRIDGRSVGDVTVDAVVADDARLAIGAAELLSVEDRMRLALAAEMLGAATRAFEITLDYLKTREQFGRRIGSFQALQHRAAQMLVEIELARGCVAHACGLADRGEAGFAEAAILAKFMAGEALHKVTNEMVQMHGGIGMTAEHVAGRFLKWARVSEAMLGSAGWLADRHAESHSY